MRHRPSISSRKSFFPTLLALGAIALAPGLSATSFADDSFGTEIASDASAPAPSAAPAPAAAASVAPSPAAAADAARPAKGRESDAAASSYSPPASSASQSDSEQPAVAEIPQAVPSAPPSAPDNATADDTQPDVSGATGAVGNKAVEDYEAAQNPPPIAAPNLHSLQEFMSEGSDESPIGLELREDRRKLKSGEEADGLLVVKVRAGSPAADAGLKGYNSTSHTVLEGAAVAAAMVFPPAILAVAVLDQTHVGESYDMIIGVDGKRVSNFLDFEDQMREAKPGDVVYLSVIRNGTRMQVPVQVPTTASGSTY